MKPVVVAAVLERFGIAPPSRDLAGLCAVYAAWCRSVSFDNVLKMIHVAEERPGSLPGSTAEGFFEDWLACGAGGTCWAGNGALHGLLEALGFDARRAIATMMPSRSPAPNHGSVVVSVEGERWITDASILTGAPIRIPAPGEPAGCTSLPRFEWLDGQPAVVWRTLSEPEGFPCRIERIGADNAEWDAFHRKTGAWSPFNFELSARVMRGTATIGVSPGQRFTIEANGSITTSPLASDSSSRSSA
jgi:N-hydroxyarylamine O-acetyltransferase